ncbi:MAG: hypothetical protein EAZ10_04710 [Oscillatoriales cyanobacterium]|nr:MAG: hypothetical protein EAZ10_04710 [Oscillatoriales cyanobacterium]
MSEKQATQRQHHIKWKPNLLLGILLLALAIPLPFAQKTLAQKQTADFRQRLFQTALYFTLYFEGGFSNHPADKGGRTYRGILQTEYNSYRYSRGLPPLDVTQMSEAELMEIYKYYWDSSLSGTMQPALAIVMFDTAVNFGINNSITFLQQALGLPQTGVFDARTRDALKSANNKNTALQMINERIIYRYKRVSRDYSLWGYVNKIK